MDTTTARPEELLRRLRAILPEADLEPLTLPGCADLALWLIAADFPTGPLDPESARNAAAHPTYWAFCWASGLAIAQTLVAHPELARGRSVLDFGSGSGVVALAAARAGAKRVVACDCDPDALVAIRANAALNGVAIETVESLLEVDRPFDLMILADALYDRENLPLLERLDPYARGIVIADARIQTAVLERYHLVGERDGATLPELGGFDEARRVRFFVPRNGDPETAMVWQRALSARRPSPP